MEVEKEQKVRLQKQFYAGIDAFLAEESLSYDRWEFIRVVGEKFREWKRRPH